MGKNGRYVNYVECFVLFCLFLHDNNTSNNAQFLFLFLILFKKNTLLVAPSCRIVIRARQSL